MKLDFMKKDTPEKRNIARREVQDAILSYKNNPRSKFKEGTYKSYNDLEMHLLQLCYKYMINSQFILSEEYAEAAREVHDIAMRIYMGKKD